MILYSVEKDFDSVTKNITLKYSVCKFDITHTAKFFSKKITLCTEIPKYLQIFEMDALRLSFSSQIKFC